MHDLPSPHDAHTSCPISFSRSDLFLRLKAKPMRMTVQPIATPGSRKIEDFIADIYARAYGANIKVHYNALMSIHDERGAILAAAGFRPAVQGPLFLEQYLEQPVERILGVPRRQIVEIGNLASDGGGGSLFLFAALSTFLHVRGYRHAMVTGTAPLQGRLRRMGLRPQRHALADPALLLHNDENWGSYYDTQPYVLSGSVTHGHKCLQTMLGTKFRSQRPRLFPRLHYKRQEHLL